MKKKRVVALLIIVLIGGCIFRESEIQKSTKLEVDKNATIHKDSDTGIDDFKNNDNPEFGSTTITIDRATGTATKDGVELKNVKIVE